MRHTCGSSRVAGDDQRLGPLLAEKPGNRQASLDDKFGSLFTVGNVPAVRQIQQRLAGQQLADFIEHRQTTDPGIEDSDRCIAAMAHMHVKHARAAHWPDHRRCTPGHA